jgi:ribosome-associated heat shock protein Hsp15
MAGGDDSARDTAAQPAAVIEAQRLDKWLWFVRVVKTRSIAQRLITEGGVRVNRARVDKPALTIRTGDIVTIALDRRVRVLKMLGGGQRRGPAPEAELLYEDLTPPVVPQEALPPVERAHPMAEVGRPSKRDRRLIERVKDRWQS